MASSWAAMGQNLTHVSPPESVDSRTVPNKCNHTTALVNGGRRRREEKGAAAAAAAVLSNEEHVIGQVHVR